MRVFVVYDDTGRKSDVISDIIGDKGFSDVVVKRQRLEDYYHSCVETEFSDIIWRKLSSYSAYQDIVKEAKLYIGEEIRFLHCFSNYIISDSKKALLSFKKINYVDEPFGVLDGKRAVAALFPDANSYVGFCRNVMSGQRAWDIVRGISKSFVIEGMTDIGSVSNFIQCITGSFDSRFYNNLKEDKYTLTKSSFNKQKIHSEYMFYQMLPEDMKYWFVQPFDYQETDSSASYKMERLHMADLSIKWVHGSMGDAEFKELMEKYFYFFRCRHTKSVSQESVASVSESLYLYKVQKRLGDLKQCDDYNKIGNILGACGIDLDQLYKEYKEAYEISKKWRKDSNYLVIGHGDPCFANALYSKSTQILKFVDPKGVLSEEELWTDAYYDVAKLSHSVCGRYDFFNSDLYDIKINNELNADLDIPFDNSRYVELFKDKCAENGFDFRVVRVYEVSLFLSMLPLHIDNPHKVLGFVLNARNILKEIENYV